ncbi:MAG: hypothetical protein IKN38_07720 [Clostridia bacterium]|nr:hypothetical protein [Clostridia bacterium]
MMEKIRETSHENKEVYVPLELEVTAFNSSDVIATSVYSNPDPDEYEMII